ncbi:RNA-binding protein NOB1, putative [Plasmodium ovale curtisi]|uniref:RNA-binding protein NOB1, putative n=1 Tax=Plasmodium ovale curtisi TaxID=864141 RepID=A0A1A8VL43_PLAOA|nr:RNA-binding protein NOB1, putative [Plasmodium ovale curtisi]
MFFSDEINTFLDRETPGDDPFKSSYSLDVTLENFPNPFIHPSLCNRSGLKYSYICDPNKMLSRNIADKIEGNPKCSDGILLLFVKEDATFLLKWKKGAQSIINFRTATSMNKSFNQYIRRYSLEYSILMGKPRRTAPTCAQKKEHLRSVKLTSQYLTEEIIPPTQTTQMVVALTIAVIVGLGYLACVLIGAQSIINFRTATSMNKSFNQYIRRYSLEYSILMGKPRRTAPTCAQKKEHLRSVKLTSQYLTEEIIPPTQTTQMVVALTIAVIVGLGYLACVLIGTR